MRFLSNKTVAKVVSALIAITMWMYVVSVENPQTEIYLKDIPIIVVNEAALNGYSLNLINMADKSVSVKVEGRRSDVSAVSSKDITATADLSGITLPGKYMINVDVYLDADGVSVKEKDVKKTEIYVDTVKAIEIPIEIKTNGMPKEGFLAGTGNGSAEKIVVKGPGGIINKIASASASVDVSGATENINVLSSVELFDYSGNIISDEYLSLSVDDITVNISILKEHEVPIIPVYSKEYDLSEYEVVVTPATVMAKTESAFSGGINTLPITINENMERDFVKEVQLDVPATVEIKEIPDRILVEFKIK